VRIKLSEDLWTQLNESSEEWEGNVCLEFEVDLLTAETTVFLHRATSWWPNCSIPSHTHRPWAWSLITAVLWLFPWEKRRIASGICSITVHSFSWDRGGEASKGIQEHCIVPPIPNDSIRVWTRLHSIQVPTQLGFYALERSQKCNPSCQCCGLVLCLGVNRIANYRWLTLRNIH
jgi:hypothetical protein